MTTSTKRSARTITALSTAIQATAGLSEVWESAYAAIAADRAAGVSLRDIAADVKAAGVKAGKDLIGDMELASRLTCHGATFQAAHSKAMASKSRGAGLAIMLPHSLITKARLARGKGYVEATLATLDGLTGDDLVKAMGKAVGALHAAKKEAAPGGKKKDTTGNDGDGDGTTGNDGEETPETVTLARLLASAAAIIDGAVKRLEAGETVTPDERDAFMAKASRLAGMLRQDAAVAV